MPPCVTGRRSASLLTVTSVVSRMGIASTRSGSSMVATVVPAARPARREAERGEEEPEQLAPRVPHEHLRTARTEVERKEAEAGEREGEREHEDEVVLVDGRGVDREVEARHRRERRGEAVHVVEEVEGVRDADEP